MELRLKTTSNSLRANHNSQASAASTAKHKSGNESAGTLSRADDFSLGDINFSPSEPLTGRTDNTLLDIRRLAPLPPATSYRLALPHPRDSWIDSGFVPLRSSQNSVHDPGFAPAPSSQNGVYDPGFAPPR